MDTPNVITTISSLVTAFMGWVGDVLDLVKSEPLLLLGISVFVVGAAVGLFRRVLGK